MNKVAQMVSHRQRAMRARAEGYEGVPSERESPPVNEEEDQITYHHLSGKLHSQTVDRYLISSDLASILGLKLIRRSHSWAIVEFWPDYGIERVLEDHEYPLAAYVNIRKYYSDVNVEFWLREVSTRYTYLIPDNLSLEEFYRIMPAQTLLDYYDVPDYLQYRNVGIYIKQGGTSRMYIITTQLLVSGTDKYRRVILVLHGGVLYVTKDAAAASAFVKIIKQQRGQVEGNEVPGVTTYANLLRHQIYITLNAKNQFRAPTAWGVILRPDERDPEADVPNIKCIGFPTEQSRSVFVTAMRLAKYGRKLRDNYFNFTQKLKDSQKQPTTAAGRDAGHGNVAAQQSGALHETEDRVAMDYTGRTGKIVTNEDEVEEIKRLAYGGGAHMINWKKRRRMNKERKDKQQQQQQPGEEGNASIRPGDTRHLGQPWFHTGLTREQATKLVMSHGNLDGVFLARDSQSHPGDFVITYKCKGKAYHTPIRYVDDPRTGLQLLTADDDTRFSSFYDLIQFYLFNQGNLATPLTFYVVFGTNTIRPIQSVIATDEPAAVERARGGGTTASSSTSEVLAEADPAEPRPGPSGMQSRRQQQERNEEGGGSS